MSPEFEKAMLVFDAFILVLLGSFWVVKRVTRAPLP